MSEIIKGYICANLTKDSASDIYNFFTKRKLECQPELHTTIIHDSELTFNPLDENHIKRLAAKGVIYGKVIGGKILGEKDSKTRTPALVISSPVIETIHDYLVKNGYHHYYDEFIAHISINYGACEEDLDKYMSAIDNLIGKPVVYEGIEVDIIKPKEE